MVRLLHAHARSTTPFSNPSPHPPRIQPAPPPGHSNTPASPVPYTTSHPHASTSHHPPIPQSTDRFNVNISFSKNWEHLQNKHVGTGHGDMTKFEWVSNQQRDTIASNIGHYDLMSYFAVAENESIGRTRYNLMEKMLAPCGPPPERDDEDE